MRTDIPVAVVGGGQAGLATSYWLHQHDIDHVVFERGESGDTWRDMRDSFCLVSPNWTLRLPGMPYDGPDPDGFMPR
jgi:putative flavoprotein involved in K+ transport